MTLDEAKADRQRCGAHLNTLYKTLQRERAMREKVIKDPSARTAGIQEIDQALAALLRLKDELKRLLQPIEQGTLLDLPKQTSY